MAEKNSRHHGRHTGIMPDAAARRPTRSIDSSGSTSTLTRTSTGRRPYPRSSPQPTANAAESTCVGQPPSSYFENCLTAKVICGQTSRWRNWIASPRANPTPRPLWRCSAPSANSFPSPAEIHRMIRDCARLPLVGPGGSKNHQKGDSVPSYLTIAFQAHPSMRICSAGRQSAHLPGTRRPA